MENSDSWGAKLPADLPSHLWSGKGSNCSFLAPIHPLAYLAPILLVQANIILGGAATIGMCKTTK